MGSIVHIGIAWVQYQSGLGYFIPSPCLCIWLGSFTLTKKLFKKIKSDAKKGEQRDNRGVKTLLPYVCRHKYVVTMLDGIMVQENSMLESKKVTAHFWFENITVNCMKILSQIYIYHIRSIDCPFVPSCFSPANFIYVFCLA